MLIFIIIGLVARLIHFFHYYTLFGFDLVMFAKYILMILHAIIKKWILKNFINNIIKSFL